MRVTGNSTCAGCGYACVVRDNTNPKQWAKTVSEHESKCPELAREAKRVAKKKG